MYRRHCLPIQPHETMRPLNFSYSPCWTGTTSSLQLRLLHRVITECGEWYFPWASIASYNGWQMWLRQLTELSANCNISLILFQIRSTFQCCRGMSQGLNTENPTLFFGGAGIWVLQNSTVSQHLNLLPIVVPIDKFH